MSYTKTSLTDLLSFRNHLHHLHLKLSVCTVDRIAFWCSTIGRHICCGKHDDKEVFSTGHYIHNPLNTLNKNHIYFLFYIPSMEVVTMLELFA